MNSHPASEPSNLWPATKCIEGVDSKKAYLKTLSAFLVMPAEPVAMLQQSLLGTSQFLP